MGVLVGIIKVLFLLLNVAHPLRCSLPHDLLEGSTECAITAETTLVGQLLGRYRLMIGYRLMV